MSLRLISTGPAAYERHLNARVVGAYVLLACIHIATGLDVEDRLPGSYLLFVLVAAMGLFVPEDNPTRVRPIALVIVLVAGVSAAVVGGLVVGCAKGVLHWLELVIVMPPLLLAVLLLRVACRQLKNKVDELERKYYTVDVDYDQRVMIACPVCGIKDEPEANHELWTLFYDARRRAFRPGLLYNSASRKVRVWACD